MAKPGQRVAWEQGNPFSHKQPPPRMPPPAGEPWAWFKALAATERGAPHFYLALGPANGVTGFGGRIVYCTPRKWGVAFDPLPDEGSQASGPPKGTFWFSVQLIQIPWASKWQHIIRRRVEPGVPRGYGAAVCPCSVPPGAGAGLQGGASPHKLRGAPRSNLMPA